MSGRVPHDRHGTGDQQPPEITLAHFRYPAKPRFAASRVLARTEALSQAEKSWPRRKLSTGGANACSTVAVISPTPGIVKSRTAFLSSRAQANGSFRVNKTGLG